MKTATLLAAILVSFLHIDPVHAHGGGLAADGCHHDRKAGTRHCHHNTPTDDKPFSRATTLTGAVTRVRDGDTIVVAGTAVRLNGVSAPELKEHHGVRAKMFMTRLVHRKQVTCELNGARTYDREVGICYHNGRDIGAALIAAGLARDCPRYSEGRYRPYENSRSRSLRLPGYCR